MDTEEKKTKIKNTWVKTPTIYQMEGTECGAASLAMILAYFGRDIPLEQLRVDCGVCRDGANMKNVKKAAAMHGLKGASFYQMPEQLIDAKVPAIIYWKFSHYVVYEGYKNGFYYINDPSKGRRKLTFDEIASDFSKVIVEFEKTDEFAPLKQANPLFTEMKKRIASNGRDMTGVGLIGLILVVPGILIPMLSQIFIDKILVGNEVSWAGLIIWAMVLVLLFQCIYSAIRMKVVTALQTKMKLISSMTFLQHMFRLPVSFFEQRLPGSLVSRVDNNNRVSQFASEKLVNTLLDVFTAIFFLIIMLFYSPLLTLIGIVGVAINIVFGRLYSKRLENMATKSQTEEQKLQGNMFVATGALETVKASGTESSYLARLLGSYAESTNAGQTVSRAAEVLSSVPQAVTKIFDALILLTGAYLVIKGNITAGVLVAFTQLLTSFTTPCNTFISFFSELKTVKADITCVNDVMKYKVSPRYAENAQTDNVDRIAGEVEFRNVTFGYTPLDAPLFENLSFTIKPGRTLALVGASGSGKSTIGKLANGLISPWSGEILYDGHPIEKISDTVFHYYVSTASQRIDMFSGTIRDNITMWNDTISDEKVLNAAKDACIHDTIVRLPGAFYSEMKEGGSNFSGGEKQRIEIARALATNPSVVILDEATSALDPIVEQQVMTNIRKRGCTCIMVAHRLSTIRDCDEILVLDHGKIVQRGTHDEMKNVPGPYSELIKVE